jgi:hypothetical protein
MEAYAAWKLHRAVSLHLTTLNYDLFEHRGRTRNTSRLSWEKFNAKFAFEGVAKEFSKPNDAVQFFIANIVYSQKDDVYDQSISWDNYQKWTRDKESLTRFISDDISKLSLPADLEGIDGKPPRLLIGYVTGNILPQTAVAINKKHQFIDSWLEKDYFGLQRYSVIIKKLDRFVKYNPDIINQLI